MNKDPWNYSSAPGGEGLQYGGGSQLKIQLQKVRAGLMDQKTFKESKYMTEEHIADRIRYLVAVTGKGPVGKNTGRWFNAIDERGLPAHCVNPAWPDWEVSASTKHPEDINQVSRDYWCFSFFYNI